MMKYSLKVDQFCTEIKASDAEIGWFESILIRHDKLFYGMRLRRAYRLLRRHHRQYKNMAARVDEHNKSAA